MTLHVFNILLMLLGPALIVAGLYGLAVVAGLPRPPSPRYPRPRPPHPSPRWAVS